MTQRTGGNIGAERAEGVQTKVEELAIMLACSAHGAKAVDDRLAMLTLWQGLHNGEDARIGYRLRAKRLLAAWGATR
jgi:hypothetical protein